MLKSTLHKHPSTSLLFALICQIFLFTTGCNEGQALSAGERPQGSDSATQSDPIPHREHADADRTRQAPTLRWNAPLSRANGDKLYPGEIAGYRLYYRSDNDARPRVIEIDESSRTSHTLSDFRPGDYYFSITTQDVKGLESARSEEITVSIL